MPRRAGARSRPRCCRPRRGRRGPERLHEVFTQTGIDDGLAAHQGALQRDDADIEGQHRRQRRSDPDGREGTAQRRQQASQRSCVASSPTSCSIGISRSRPVPSNRLTPIVRSALSTAAPATPRRATWRIGGPPEGWKSVAHGTRTIAERSGTSLDSSDRISTVGRKDEHRDVLAHDAALSPAGVPFSRTQAWPITAPSFRPMPMTSVGAARPRAETDRRSAHARGSCRRSPRVSRQAQRANVTTRSSRAFGLETGARQTNRTRERIGKTV